MNRLRRSLLPALVAACLASPPAQADFVTVSLDPIANWDMRSGYFNNPTGSPVSLGGVAFEIPSDRQNAWHANTAANGGNAVVQATLNVSIFGATAVHTLINSWWGIAGPSSYASVRFLGSDGADYTYSLTGNWNLRDLISTSFTTTINDPDTLNVFTDTQGSNPRIDKQFIMLPEEFLTQTLTSITFTDRGGYALQRIFVSGVTVETAAVPEPTAIAMMAGGAVAVGIAARRRGRIV